MQKEVKEKINLCKEYKRRIKLLDKSFKKGLLSKEEYNKSLKGRTPKIWINYYNECIQYYNNNYSSFDYNKLLIPLIIILFGLGIFFFFNWINNGEIPITGFAIYENNTLLNKIGESFEELEFIFNIQSVFNKTFDLN